MLKNVYHALIHSYLRYGILVWGNASQTTLEPLDTLVNKAIRIICNLPSGNIDFDPIYKELKFLQLHKIHKLETGKFIFKEKNGLLPTTIGNCFTVASSEIPHDHGVRHERSHRFMNNLRIGEKSVQFFARDLWNTIPTEIKSADSFNIFKKDYKKYLNDLNN